MPSSSPDQLYQRYDDAGLLKSVVQPNNHHRVGAFLEKYVIEICQTRVDFASLLNLLAVICHAIEFGRKAN